MLLGEAHVGEDVLLGLVQQGRELGQLGPDLVGDLAPLGLGGVGMILSKRGGDEGRDDALAVAAGVGEGVAHEMHPAALPSRAEHPGDRRLDALVGIRDHQLDPGQAAPLEPTQELDPEGLGLGGAERAILSSVFVVVPGQWLQVATQPYRRSCDGHPLWIAGLPTPDSWRSLRQASYPQLLHHQSGRDPQRSLQQNA